MPNDFKDPNTNLESNPDRGTWVEAINPPQQGAPAVPVRFVPRTMWNHPAEMLGIGKPATGTRTAPDGTTVWPTVSVDNSDHRNPVGDGSEFDAPYA